MRNNLIKERKKKNLTQIDLAGILNITERHYRDLEHGDSRGSMEVWEKLKELFHKPIDYLYKNTKKPDSNQVKKNTIKG